MDATNPRNEEESPSSQRKIKTEKLQQHIEQLCGAAIRATTNQPSFRFRGQRPEINGRSALIKAPHLRPDYLQDDFRSFRGAADAIALRLKHSDQDLHQQLMPKSNLGQLIFELLEQIRCESLVNHLHIGAQKNLEHRFRQWCKHYCSSETIENQLGLLIFTITQVVWCRLTSLPMNHESEDIIESMRMMIAPDVGQALMGMRKNTTNQRVFSNYSLMIVDVIDSLIAGQENDENISDDDIDSVLKSSDFSLFMEPDIQSEGEMTTAGKSYKSTGIRDIIAQLEQYKIYTTKYDEVIVAENLVLSDQLDQLCKVHDELLKNQAINIPRLARELSKIIPGKQFSGWDFSQEEGYIDGSMLSTLITSPQYRNIFRQQKQHPNGNCIVSFVIDNSGSMKEHIRPISTLVTILSKAFEMAGAKTEILGFTTRSWQGGKSYKDWMRNLRPQNPGRLCETRHIIYKDANTLLKRARRSISVMLKPDLFKESVDGEALLWAANRLQLRPEAKKIIIVLSDGCPMESATNQKNEKQYLDNHLQQVATMIETTSDIELYALGFGLDLSPYYQNSVALSLPEKIENSMLKQIINLLKNKKQTIN